MAVKLRLSRQGRKKAPFYHIVVADARAPRDGKFIEKIGTYNPLTSPATIEIDRNAAYDWLVKGAQPTDTVRAILRFKGVYYKRHLMRGLKKGALTVEQVDKMWAEWIDAKEGKIATRKAQKKQDLELLRTRISGEAKPAKAVADTSAADAFKADSNEVVAEEEVAVGAAPVDEAVEETPVVEETPTVEETPVVEETPTVEEAPVVEAEAVVEAPAVEEEAPAAEPANDEAPTEEA